jgi:hypothetical protein
MTMAWSKWLVGHNKMWASIFQYIHYLLVGKKEQQVYLSFKQYDILFYYYVNEISVLVNSTAQINSF